MSKIKDYNIFRASLEKRTLTLSCVGGADPSSRIASTAAMILCSMYRHYYCSPVTRISFSAPSQLELLRLCPLWLQRSPSSLRV